LKRSFPPLKWRAPTDLLILLLGLPRGKPVLRRSRRMAAAIILEVGVGDAVMRAGRMIFIRGQLAAELDRAHVRRVLVADAAAIEGLVGDRQRKLADHVCGFADGEGVFADERLYLESDELHDDVVLCHLAPTADAMAGAATAFLRRLVRRLGGVPSAGSTTIMLVTNFFMPWRSKSMEVRSESDSVTTPRPYWKCLMYC